MPALNAFPAAPNRELLRRPNGRYETAGESSAASEEARNSAPRSGGLSAALAEVDRILGPAVLPLYERTGSECDPAKHGGGIPRRDEVRRRKFCVARGICSTFVRSGLNPGGNRRWRNHNLRDDFKSSRPRQFRRTRLPKHGSSYLKVSRDSQIFLIWRFRGRSEVLVPRFASRECRRPKDLASGRRRRCSVPTPK
jgi:hypothetical protein